MKKKIETAALDCFNNKFTHDKVLEPNVAYGKLLKNKNRFIVDKKYKTVKIVDIDDIYAIDELTEEYQDYIDKEDLKHLF